nr:bifunctional precorrin-2 dehydrogenase/sirohydrochlorin ferrochelatase [Aliamphritea spongicola]
MLVGGGQVALRKATLLVRARAQVKVISHQILPELAELVEQNNGEAIIGEYQAQMLDNVDLVIAATDNLSLNEQVHSDAVARHIPVNVVDKPDLCSFIFPAIVDRSPLVIGVSSGGESPVLSRLMRAKLET